MYYLPPPTQPPCPPSSVLIIRNDCFGFLVDEDEVVEGEAK